MPSPVAGSPMHPMAASMPTSRLAGGHWARGDNVAAYDPSRHRGANGDLDSDGVLNRDDRDRDGDGVLNWDDARPGNPLRN